MVAQIFKKTISKEILLNFLKKFCSIDNDYLLINKAAYNKAKYHNYIEPFLNELKEYYHTSKHFYLTRKLTYNYFLTIIRQLCKHINIKYDIQILYIKSIYHVNIYVFMN